MESHSKMSIVYFSMIIVSCTAFKLVDSDKALVRHPRNPRVVYDSRFEKREGEIPDLASFKDSFGPKVREGLSEIVPSTSQTSVREQYQSFKDSAYNGESNDGYSDRNFDLTGGADETEGREYQANEDAPEASFEHFAGNFEVFDGGFEGGEFFDNADNSGEKKDPEADEERNPEFDANEDLSA